MDRKRKLYLQRKKNIRQRQHTRRITKKPKGWVDNPKTLEDVIQSLQALGATVTHRPLREGMKPADVRL